MEKEKIILRLTESAKTALKVMAAQQKTSASALVESWINEHSA